MGWSCEPLLGVGKADSGCGQAAIMQRDPAPELFWRRLSQSPEVCPQHRQGVWLNLRWTSPWLLVVRQKFFLERGMGRHRLDPTLPLIGAGTRIPAKLK
ncbi:MAG: hypothetical protein ACJAZN_001555 [Planctomycetota bacterium]|jgi:hypothetical protein